VVVEVANLRSRTTAGDRHREQCLRQRRRREHQARPCPVALSEFRSSGRDDHCSAGANVCRRGPRTGQGEPRAAPPHLRWRCACRAPPGTPPL